MRRELTNGEPKRVTKLGAELASFVPGYVGLATVSIFVALTRLAVPLFVIQVYNRVILSRNLVTLAFLVGLIVGVLLVGAILDTLRAKTVKRMANTFDQRVGPSFFARLYQLSPAAGAGAGVSAIRDFNSLRDIMGGNAILDIMDAILAPLFLIVLFLINPIFGVCALGFVLLGVTAYIIGQSMAVSGLRKVDEFSRQELDFISITSRNAEPVRVMGLVPGLFQRWRRLHLGLVGWQASVQEHVVLFQAISRFLNAVQWPFFIALGAILYIQGDISHGAIYGGMLLATRALGPIYALFGQWRNIANAKTAYARLKAVLDDDSASSPMALPRPDGRLALANVFYRIPNTEKLLLNEVSFTVDQGRVLGIVGQSGAGKSTLARILVGALPPWRGTVTLDGYDLTQWDQNELGRYLGYVPQDIEFLPGTVSENISRFEELGPDGSSAVIAGARLAGAEGLIQGLPDGYNTRLGVGGHVLSGGQRQSLALARAVYGHPSLVVMDEPNSNLDANGEEALGRLIERLREQGTTVVLVTHKLNMLVFCDEVLVLHGGAVHAYGSREDIMRRIPPQRLTALRAVEGAR